MGERVLVGNVLNGIDHHFNPEEQMLISVVAQGIIDRDDKWIRSPGFELIMRVLGFDANRWRNEYFRNSKKLRAMCKTILSDSKPSSNVSNCSNCDDSNSC